MSLFVPRNSNQGRYPLGLSARTLRHRAHRSFVSIIEHFRNDFDHLATQAAPIVPTSARESLRDLLPTLQDDIEYLMRSCGEPDDVRYSVQVRMVPDDEREWQPRLLVLCGTDSLRHYLKSELESYSSTLSELSFRGPPIFETFDYAAKQDYDLSASTSHIGNNTLGSSFRLKSRGTKDEYWDLTIGGAILVDETPYGLTIGHYKTCSGSHERGKESRSSGKHNPGLLERKIEEEHFGFDKRTNQAVDWALVSVMGGSHFMSNHLRLPTETTPSSLVDEIITEHQFVSLPEIRSTGRAKCVVATPLGLIPGFVVAGLSTMVLDDASFEVLSVELKKLIPAGSSGSWVVVDNRLLGSIIAAEDVFPRAYVLPIEATFRSIKDFFKASQVSLPSAVQTRIFELDHVPRLLPWLEPVNLSHSLERDFLLAVRKADTQSKNNEFHRTVTRDGIGWAGIRRGEVVGNPYNLIEPCDSLSLKTRMYERLTHLKMDTIKSLMRIGHMFPIHAKYRAVFLQWVTRNKVSHVRGTRAIAMRIILEECLGTEAGENLLGLICMLKVLLILRREHRKNRASKDSKAQLRAVWIGRLIWSIFKGLEFPPTQIPSQPQIQTFVFHCLEGFRGAPRLEIHEPFPGTRSPPNPEAFLRESAEPASVSNISLESLFSRPEDDIYEELSGVQFFARMLLQLSDLVNCPRGEVLVCSGEPWARWAQTIAKVLGNTVSVRSYQANHNFSTVGPEELYPNVYVYIGIDLRISEVMERKRMSLPQETVTSGEITSLPVFVRRVHGPRPSKKKDHKEWFVWNRARKRTRFVSRAPSKPRLALMRAKRLFYIFVSKMNPLRQQHSGTDLPMGRMSPP